jgi:hypothetical protein
MTWGAWPIKGCYPGQSQVSVSFQKDTRMNRLSLDPKFWNNACSQTWLIVTYDHELLAWVVFWGGLLYSLAPEEQDRRLKTIWSRRTSLHVRWHDPKLDALQEVYRSLSHSVYEPVFLHVSMSLHSSYFVSITHVWMTERLITDLPKRRSLVALGRSEQSHIQGWHHCLVVW